MFFFPFLAAAEAKPTTTSGAVGVKAFAGLVMSLFLIV